MKCHLFVSDHLQYWQEDSLVAQKCKSQHDVYLFDPEAGTYCCELVPSYYMVPAYNTFALKDDLEDDDCEIAEEVDEALMDTTEGFDALYVHCSSIRDLPHFKDNEIPSELPKCFVIEWDDDPEIEDLVDFLENISGNPPV